MTTATDSTTPTMEDRFGTGVSRAYKIALASPNIGIVSGLQDAWVKFVEDFIKRLEASVKADQAQRADRDRALALSGLRTFRRKIEGAYSERPISGSKDYPPFAVMGLDDRARYHAFILKLLAETMDELEADSLKALDASTSTDKTTEESKSTNEEPLTSPRVVTYRIGKTQANESEVDKSPSESASNENATDTATEEGAPK